MSWLFSRALVAEYSAATCWDGAPSAPLSVTPTQHKFWRSDKTVEPSDLSRFGLTCAVLTADRGADLLTWYLVASRARTSASPGKAPALTVFGLACGVTWRGSLAKFDPASSTWRTAQPSLLEDLDECSVIWPRSGMTAGGQCWELPTLALPTSATGSGSLPPTPTASNYGSCQGGAAGREGQPNRPSLQTMASKNAWPTPTASLGTKGGRVTPRKSLEGGTLIEAVSAATKWPTPTVCGNYNRKGASKSSGDGLATAIAKWRTPNTVDAKGGTRAPGADSQVQLCHQVGGSLNPTWVEWLMGWPIGWTDLEPSETDKCRCVQ